VAKESPPAGCADATSCGFNNADDADKGVISGDIKSTRGKAPGRFGDIPERGDMACV